MQEGSLRRAFFLYIIVSFIPHLARRSRRPRSGSIDAADVGSAGEASEGTFMSNQFKSGFVTLVGRPNVGKSSLINAVVGHKVAITSSTAQTTRHRFRAILTTDDAQVVMVLSLIHI